MAGQTKALAILAGVLIAAVAAAVWLMSSAGTDEPSETGGGDAAVSAGAAAPDEPGKPAAATGRAKRQGTATLFGEIRRSLGKAPVAGQDVLLTPQRGDAYRVTTDAQGAFRFEKVPHGEAFELSAAAKGCGTIRIPGIALDRNEKRNVGTLYLDPSVKVTVRVRSSADGPVAGATVEAFRVPQWVDWDWSKALAQIGQVPISVAKGESDANGEVLFPEMAVGDWTFAARKDGYATSGERGLTLRSGEEPKPVVIYMNAGYPLDGRVLGADGKAIANALVMAGGVNSAWDLSSAPLRSRVTTDAEGRYAFAALPSGDSQLWIGRANGIPSPSATVRVPLVQHYDIVLRAAGRLTGSVTNADDGKLVEGAVVRATSWESGTARSGEAVSDAEGKYAIEMAEGAINQLTVEKEGLVQVRDATVPAMGMQRQATLREGATVVRDLKLRRGARLSGTVRGPDGVVAGARVSVAVGTQNEGFNQKTATTDAAGHYEFAAVDKGTLLVLAAKEGFYLPDEPEQWWDAAQTPDAAKEFKVEVGETGEATKDFELKRGSTVSGTVEGPDGGPLAGVRVRADGAEDAAATGADGAYRLEGVKPGAAVTLWCAKDGFVCAAPKPIAVAAGEPVTGIVLRMLREPRISGQIAAKSGGSLRDPRILLAYEQGEEQESPWTEQWRWQNATRIVVKPDGTYDAPVPYAAGGRILLRAMSLDRQSEDAKPIPLVEGQEQYHADFVLEDGSDVLGKVVTKSGAPVAGADISLAPHRGQDVNQMVWGGGGDPPVWAVTGADGAFRVPHLAPGKWDVRAEARGFVTARAVADLAVGTPVVVEMSPEMTIEGTVVLADGRGVEGLEVTANSGQDAMPAFGGFMQQDRTATTDANGAFRVTGVAEGRYTVRVALPWGSEQNVRAKSVEGVAAGVKDLKVVLEEGGRIAGHVVDLQRRAVSGAWVQASATVQEGEQPALSVDDQWHGAMTKPDGTFVVVGLAPGQYSLDVSSGGGTSAGHRPRHLDNVAVGTKDVEVILEDGLSITGVILGPGDKPVGQMALQAVPAVPDGENQAGGTNCWADAQGKFTLSGLAPGAYRIQVAPWGGSNQGWAVTSSDPVQAGASGVRLSVTKGITISGVVVDENGKPIAGANIAAAGMKGGSWRSAQSREDGTFEVGGLAAGESFHISVNSAGRVPFQLAGVQPGATVRAVLAKGLMAKGRLLDATGKPMPNASISLAHSDGAHHQSVNTDGEGNFTADGLVEGSYAAQVYVQTKNDGDWKPCGSVKAGETTVELRVP